jgi:hypothetical protein
MWALNREKVMLDTGITDLVFEELQQRIEASLPGRWQRLGTDGGCTGTRGCPRVNSLRLP